MGFNAAPNHFRARHAVAGKIPPPLALHPILNLFGFRAQMNPQAWTRPQKLSLVDRHVPTCLLSSKSHQKRFGRAGRRTSDERSKERVRNTALATCEKCMILDQRLDLGLPAQYAQTWLHTKSGPGVTFVWTWGCQVSKNFARSRVACGERVVLGRRLDLGLPA